MYATALFPRGDFTDIGDILQLRLSRPAHATLSHRAPRGLRSRPAADAVRAPGDRAAGPRRPTATSGTRCNPVAEHEPAPAAPEASARADRALIAWAIGRDR